MAGPLLFHGTAVLWRDRGLLLRAPSGGGKSDLAWRVLLMGGQLVGDDYVWLTGDGGRLFAMAPEAIRGRMELRGVGILRVPARPVAEIHALVDLVDQSRVERLPEPRFEVLCGVSLPLYALAPFEASAAAKVAAIAEVCKNRDRYSGPF